MEEKETNHVTLEDLASMIERNIAHKEDIDRLENHLVKMDVRLDRIEATLQLIATAVADNRDFARRLELLEAKVR